MLEDIGANVDERMAAYQWAELGRGVLGIPLPWPAIMRATGGMRDGEVWGLFARENKGKSWVLIYLANWLHQRGYNVLFISMETPPHAPKYRSSKHRVIRETCTRCYATNVDPEEDCPATTVRRQQLTERFDAAGAGISAWRMLKKILRPDEMGRLKAYYEALKAPQNYGWGRLKIVSAPHIRTVADVDAEMQTFQPDIVLWDSAYVAAQQTERRKLETAASHLARDIAHLAEDPTLFSVL